MAPHGFRNRIGLEIKRLRAWGWSRRAVVTADFPAVPWSWPARQLDETVFGFASDSGQALGRRGPLIEQVSIDGHDPAATAPALPARTRAGCPRRCPPGQLHRMGGVEDHRRPVPRMIAGERMSGYQVVVAERDAALQIRDVPRRSPPSRLRRPDHVAGRQELAFLMFTGPAGPRPDEIGLAAEEGRRLQDVGDRCDLGDLVLACVGQDRHPISPLHFGEGMAILVLPRPPERFARTDWLVRHGTPAEDERHGVPARSSFMRPATSTGAPPDSATHGEWRSGTTGWSGLASKPQILHAGLDRRDRSATDSPG